MSRLPLSPAACERRALDGVAGFGEAMKGDGVKRLRKEEIAGRDKGCEAEDGVYRRLRSVEYQCDSDGAGLELLSYCKRRGGRSDKRK